MKIKNSFLALVVMALCACPVFADNDCGIPDAECCKLSKLPVTKINYPTNLVDITTAMKTNIVGIKKELSDRLGDVAVDQMQLTDEQKAKGITFVKEGYEENGSVTIGKDAQASISKTKVNSLTSANTLRNVGVAIGTRAVAKGLNDIKNQSIAIGYCAHAKGSNAIAIGGGARGNETETDLTGDNAYAAADAAVALGYNTKSIKANSTAIGSYTKTDGIQSVALGFKANTVGSGSVQIGAGTNKVSNSLQFRDTPIVQDGKLVNGYYDNTLDPKQTDLSTVTPSDNDVWEISVKPHVINTLDSSVALGVDKEVGLNPIGSRNYEVFIPNNDNIRSGMPIHIADEIADTSVKVLFKSKRDFVRLPIMMKVSQPHPKFVIIEAEVMDDGHDWTPSIDNVNLTVKDITNPTFSQVDKNTNAIRGINLHGATKVSIVYPTQLDPLVTTTVIVEQDDTSKDPNSIMTHYYYDGMKTFPDTPATGIALNGTSTWFDLVYETPNGTVTKRVNVNVEL